MSIFPARRSNEITEEYYNFLIGHVNRGTCSHKVSRVLSTMEHIVTLPII